MERHEVANRNNPDWPTSAIGLMRTNETVRQALGFSDGHLPCIGARMMFRGGDRCLSRAGRIRWPGLAFFPRKTVSTVVGSNHTYAWRFERRHSPCPACNCTASGTKNDQYL